MDDCSEFSIIQSYFAGLTHKRDDVNLGIGDDGALLTCPSHHYLVVSIDTLVEGVHFFADVDAESLGYKSLAVGLSDLAAMAAVPAWCTLALTIPKIDRHWLEKFSQGLAGLAHQYGVELVGGDMTRGPLTISIQVHGFAHKQHALRRDGAQVGDDIYVTGTLGDAGAALKLKLNQLDESVSEVDRDYLNQRLQKPTPRVQFARQVSTFATAAIDVSDGLFADLGHILNKSKVGACLDLTQLPLSPVLNAFRQDRAQQLALYGGDDYELCFTAPPHHANDLQHLSAECRRIGVINADVGVLSADINGRKVALKGRGYDHFLHED